MSDPTAPVRHRALAAAAARLRAEPGDPAWTALLAEAGWGRILLDGTGSSIRMPEAGVVGEGSTLSIRTVTDEQGEAGLVAFTSPEEVQRVHPGEDPASLITFVQEALGTLAGLRDQFSFLSIDPGGANVRIYRDAAQAVVRGTFAPELKEALARDDADPERQEAVVAALVRASHLALSAVPESQDDPEGVAVHTHTTADGAVLSMAFTSTFEVAIATPGQGTFVVPARTAVERAAARGTGLLLNPGTRGIVLGAEAVERALSTMPAA